jgi:hypothetical protein
MLRGHGDIPGGVLSAGERVIDAGSNEAYQGALPQCGDTFTFLG